jgi:hypothetical protein
MSVERSDVFNNYSKSKKESSDSRLAKTIKWKNKKIPHSRNNWDNEYSNTVIIKPYKSHVNNKSLKISKG